MNLTRDGCVAVLAFLMLAAVAFAAEEPSTWFCIKARQHRAQFPAGPAGEKAAIEAARAQGADDEIIAKAKLCRR